MSKELPISIVVPTLNEAGNMSSLLSRIDTTMTAAKISYEVIVIDDNSSDDTFVISQNLENHYPLRTITKQGKRGKAYSLLQGFKTAKYPLVAMIDADLQYPPEELAHMYRLLIDSEADLIVTNRLQKKVSALRKLSTKVFNLIFARALFGLKFDTQSGLKLFRKNMLSSFTMKPSPWSFDLEFIVRAIEHKYKIASHDIVFEERTHGQTKVRLLNVTFELAKAAVQLRWRTSSSQVKEGARLNNSFIKKAFPIITGLVLIAGLTVSLTKPATALTLNPTSSSVTSSLLDGIRDVLTPNNNTLPAQPVLVSNENPVEGPDNQPIAPTSSDSQQQAPTTPSMNSTTRSSSLAVNSQVQKATNPQSTASAKLVGNDGTLAAATSTNKKTGVYESGYPYYILSDSATKRFNDTAQIAFTAGLVCIVVVVLIYVTRSLTRSSRILTQS